MELQAKWIARVLSGKTILASKLEMLADVQQHYRHMEENGVPKHRMHALQGVAVCMYIYMYILHKVVPFMANLRSNDGFFICLACMKFEYLDWLAAEAGVPPVDDVIKNIHTKYFQVIVDSYPWVGPFRDLNIHNLIL